MSRHAVVRVGTVENSGPNRLVSFLRGAATGARQIDIGVAFVTAAGLNSVLYLLQAAAKRGEVRVLTGLYQGFTEPAALKTLLREQEASEGRFSVHLSRDPRFHWKAYYLIGRATSNVVIGSSNLTDDGLRSTGELNAVLTLRTDSRTFRDVHGVFDRHWRTRSRKLDGDMLRAYQTWRTSAGVTLRRPAVPIKTILGAAAKEPQRIPEREPRFWRTCVTGNLSKATLSLLSETTDWDRRGYGYLSTFGDFFARGDRIILFDMGANTIYAVEVRDTTRTPNRTPDGHHFAAYRRVRGIPLRRLGATRWRSLRVEKLIRVKEAAYETRKLTQKGYGRFIEYLRSG